MQQKEIIKYNNLSMCSPEEMARILKVTFIILPEDIDLGQMTLCKMGDLSKLCANRMVDFLIQNKRRWPSGYWDMVKKEINSNHSSK